MSTTPQSKPTTKRLVAVIIITGDSRTSIAYITEARATELYVAGELALVESGHGEFVYALRRTSQGASVGGAL